MTVQRCEAKHSRPRRTVNIYTRERFKLQMEEGKSCVEKRWKPEESSSHAAAHCLWTAMAMHDKQTQRHAHHRRAPIIFVYKWLAIRLFDCMSRTINENDFTANKSLTSVYRRKTTQTSGKSEWNQNKCNSSRAFDGGAMAEPPVAGKWESNRKSCWKCTTNQGTHNQMNTEQSRWQRASSVYTIAATKV